MAYNRPRRDKRERGAPHLLYECRMFFSSWELSLTTAGKPELWNALLEASLIHTRNLMLALRERRHRRYPDVLFRDYLAVRDWSRLKSELIPDAETEVLIEDIGRFVAHVSYGRTRLRSRARWGMRHTGWVVPRLRLWYNALTDSERSWFAPLGGLLP